MSQHPSAAQDGLNADNTQNHDHELGLTSDLNSNEIISVVPSICGVPLKHVSLVTLALQNSSLTLIMHYSRISSPPSRTYSAATAVLMNEILKGLISLFIAYARIDPSPTYHSPYSELTQATGSPWFQKLRSLLLIKIQRLSRDIFSPDCWKLSIPAILYVVQNNLQYVAVSNLDAATFQVTYQMKILTTAGFSVLLLRRKLSSSQWLALLFLAIGVGIVQIQAGTAKMIATNVASSADTHTMNGLKGFMAVAAACFTSGLAGVYFEMVLKNSQSDLWVRNVQLSLFSVLPALVPVIFSHASNFGLSSGGLLSTLFRNFGVWAWATVFVQVIGGLLTAMVIKYSDNILKGFATSLSIVISFLASTILFDFKLTFTFVLGSVIVLIATWLYNQPSKRVNITNADSVLRMLRNEKPRDRASFSLQRSNTSPSMYKGSLASSSSSLSLYDPALPHGKEKLAFIR